MEDDNFEVDQTLDNTVELLTSTNVDSPPEGEPADVEKNESNCGKQIADFIEIVTNIREGATSDGKKKNVPSNLGCSPFFNLLL